MAQAARRPSRSISPRVLEWIGEQHDISGVRRLAGRVSGRDAEKVTDFLSDLEAIRAKAEGGATIDVLGYVRDAVHLDRSMEALETSRRNLDRSAQTDDLNALTALASLHPDPRGFEEWLTDSLGRPGSPDGVMLATIHSVKGREWPHVVLHDVAAGLLPHRLASDIEEERRIFHVGLTRAATAVHVVAGTAPSPFVAQLRREYDPRRAPTPTTGSQKPARPNSASRPGRGPAREEPTVVPEVGGGFTHGGHRYEIVEVNDEGVVGTVGRAQMTVSYGISVTVDGRRVKLVRAAASPDVIVGVREALRAWRAERAARDHKPAFVYLHDKTIDEMAEAAPTTMVALARVSGIGPAKIGQYGEEWLELIAAATAR
jgi:hypothetical protein